MTILAAGASATINASAGSKVSVATNGGFYLVTETPVVGNARTTAQTIESRYDVECAYFVDSIYEIKHIF